MNNILYYSFQFIFLLTPFYFFSQIQILPIKKINIIKSDVIQKNPKIFNGNIFLSGHVELECENMKLFADTILLNELKNTIEARSNVKIYLKNGLFFFCKKSIYNINNKIALAEGNVIISSHNRIIYTEKFYYNKKTNKGKFKEWGAIKDIDTGNLISSKIAIFNFTKKKYLFKIGIKIINNDYLIESTKIIINNNSKRFDFFGPTFIKDLNRLSNYIYTENGYHDFKKQEFFFNKKSKIYYDGKIIQGNYIYYNENKKNGKILGNVLIVDNSEKIILKSGKMTFSLSKDSISLTQNPYGIKILNKDSLYFSCENLISIKENKDIKKSKNIIKAFKNVKFFKSNIQGICDSIKIDQNSGIFEFYQNPIFWSGDHQITSDTIFMYMNLKTDKLDSICFYNNAFWINKINLLFNDEFNQIKGSKLKFIFNENNFYTILVEGNAQSIIYFYEKNKTNINNNLNINESHCGSILIKFNQKIKSISCKDNGYSRVFNYNFFTKKEYYFSNFIWIDKKRLKKGTDIIKKISNK